MSGPVFHQGCTLLGIFAAAVVQILVHLHYFLHLDSSSEARWNVMILIYTVLIMIIFVGGSIWIMYSLYQPHDVTMSETLRNYGRVAKPGIVLGNLITAAGGFFLGSRGRIDAALLSATLTGIALTVAAGCVLNNCIDRKIDRKMTRTCGRALARGTLSLPGAVGYALFLGVAGIALLEAATNPLCVSLVLAGLVVYVLVYSLYLKRRSLYAALIGSLGRGGSSSGRLLRGHQPL